MNAIEVYQPALEGELMTAEEADCRRFLKAGMRMAEEMEARAEEAYDNFWRGIWQPAEPTMRSVAKF